MVDSVTEQNSKSLCAVWQERPPPPQYGYRFSKFPVEYAAVWTAPSFVVKSFNMILPSFDDGIALAKTPNYFRIAVSCFVGAGAFAKKNWMKPLEPSCMTSSKAVAVKRFSEGGAAELLDTIARSLNAPL